MILPIMIIFNIVKKEEEGINQQDKNKLRIING